MLRREGHVLMRHPHKFLPRCYAVLELPPDFPGLGPGYTRSTPALVLELMEEGSLQRLLRRQRLAPWWSLYDITAALEWGTQVAEALAHLHGLDPPVVHRDVKASNVLLSRRSAPPSPLPASGGGGGDRPGGRELVARLVDLGLHTITQAERHRRQPLFRASLQSVAGGPGGGCSDDTVSGGAAAAYNGGGNSDGGSDGRAVVCRTTSSSVNWSAMTPATGAGAAAGGCGRSETCADGRELCVLARDCGGGGGGNAAAAAVPTLTSLFVTRMDVDGAALLVPVDPHCPGFRNLDVPLKELALPSPPPPPPLPSPPPPPPPKPHPLSRKDQSSPLPPRPQSTCCMTGGDGGGGGGGDGGDERPSSSAQLLIVQVISPRRLAAAARLPFECRATPRRLREGRNAAACSADGGGGGGCVCGGGGGADGGDGDCGSCSSSEDATEVGLCSWVSGRSLHFLFPTSELDGAVATEARAVRHTVPYSPVPFGEAELLGPGATVDTGGGCAMRTTTPAQRPGQQQPQQQQEHMYGPSAAALDSDGGDVACDAVRHDGSETTGVKAAGCNAARQSYGTCYLMHPVHISCAPSTNSLCVREVPLLPPPACDDSSIGVQRRLCMQSYMTPCPQGGVHRQQLSPPPPPPLLPPLPSLAWPAGALPCERVYRLTGKTGSYMSMAPEVYLELPYNEKADVFSFAVLLYELCSHSLLLTTYVGVMSPEFPRSLNSCEQFARAVARGFRPPRVPSIPGPVWNLISQSWHQDPNVRPTMAEVVQRLRAITATSRAEADAAAAAITTRTHAAATAAAAEVKAAAPAAPGKRGRVAIPGGGGGGGGQPDEYGGMTVLGSTAGGCLPRCRTDCVIC